MSTQSQTVNTNASQQMLREALVRGTVENPALQRLKVRILTETKPSEVITSFDRMHHRHNRS